MLVLGGHTFKLRVPRCHTDIAGRFFSARIVPLWNRLPHTVVNQSSIEGFKRGLANFLGDSLYDYD